MLTILPSVAILIILFLFELLYFKIASTFKIIDKPNERSSHQKLTLTGGGIIFCIAGLIFYIYSGFQNHYFVFGLLAIGAISLIDDIFILNNKVRLSIHLFATILLLAEWSVFDIVWYRLFLILLLILAIINAYNFMDGINGMTGGYSLITILTLFYINNQITYFTSNDILIVVGLSLLVFNFFNFRKKAKCFAGDVGSIAMAFILIFMIGRLVIATQHLDYILLLFLYGLDTSTTIVFRLIRKENITKAHRTHFYQFLVNKLGYSHLSVSLLYVVVQLFLNFILILFIKTNADAVVFLISVAVIFLTLRFILEGRKVLLKPNSEL